MTEKAKADPIVEEVYSNIETRMAELGDNAERNIKELNRLVDAANAIHPKAWQRVEITTKAK